MHHVQCIVAIFCSVCGFALFVGTVSVPLDVRRNENTGFYHRFHARESYLIDWLID